MLYYCRAAQRARRMRRLVMAKITAGLSRKLFNGLMMGGAERRGGRGRGDSRGGADMTRGALTCPVFRIETRRGHATSVMSILDGG
jgi:hypothetical protein